LSAVLASWFRLKYPHVAMGAVASSAPILQFDDITPWSSFYDAVSEDFKVLELHYNIALSSFLGIFIIVVSFNTKVISGWPNCDWSKLLVFRKIVMSALNY
jgi:hypothetical protein